MKIRLLKGWMHFKKGAVLHYTEFLSRRLIRQGVAEEVMDSEINETKPEKKKPGRPKEKKIEKTEQNKMVESSSVEK